MVSFKLPALEVVTPVQKDEPALLHRSLLERPHKVLKAAGSYLYLEDGRKILDGCGGAAVINIGHGNAEVMADTLAQMQKVSYVHTGFYTTDSAEDLAACILGNQRGGSFDSKLVRAYFVGSGSEANDAALKCAKQFWSEKGEMQRKYYVSRRQAYHGNTIGAMSVSSNLPRKVPYMDITLSNVSYVSPAYAYQYQTPFETEAEYVARLAKELDDEFQRLGPENVISFMYAKSYSTVSPASLFGLSLKRMSQSRAHRRRNLRLRARAQGLLRRDPRRLRQIQHPLTPRRNHVRHRPHRHLLCL